MTTREKARKLWLEKLRSGEYEQSYGVLHDSANERYCCLGVACDLFADGLGVKREHSCGVELFDGCISSLPQPITNLLGLHSPSGATKGGNRPCLAVKNDSGKTFAEIADLLETGNYWK